jgi:hypothetical protein
MSNAEIASAVAAVISAVGGVFAVLAAFRSAKSAQLARQAMTEIEFRERLREVAVAATQISVEADRVKLAAQRLQALRRELAIHTGGLGGSKQKLAEAQIAESLVSAASQAERAKPFENGASNLRKAPPEEVDRVIQSLTSALVRVQAMYAELSTDAASAEAQCAQFREAAIAKGARL